MIYYILYHPAVYNGYDISDDFQFLYVMLEVKTNQEEMNSFRNRGDVFMWFFFQL